MGITITVDTSELDGPGFSDWMIVCYTIHNSETDGDKAFHKGDRLGIDLPGDTAIMPPEEPACIGKAPRYELDGKGPGPAGLVERDGQQDVVICFVAKKGAMRRGDLSLEIQRYIGGGGGGMVERWKRLPFEGGAHGVGRKWLPPAIALADPGHGNHEHAALAASIGEALAARRVIVSMCGPEEQAAPPRRKG